MQFAFSQGLFFVLAAALVGGIAAKLVRTQVIIGYILAGVVFGAILPGRQLGLDKLAEIGIILLLFSVGLEVSLARLSRVFRVAVFGGLIQVITTSLIGFFVLRTLGIAPAAAGVFAFAFSISSTAVIVKVLSERGESDSIHGEVMVGWSLIQDLTVIPAMIILSAFAQNSQVSDWIASISRAVLSSGILIAAIVVLGKFVLPYVIHKIAGVNSRELLVLSAIVLALGVAALASALGISPALGAFLAGVVISETQENHAIFGEIRPLRDIFVALFFVTLGFLVIPSVIVSKFGLIIGILLVILVLKFVLTFALSLLFGYHGKTAVGAAVGLSQVSELSFIIFSQGQALGFLSPELASLGIWIALLSIIISPLTFSAIVPIWKKIKNASERFPRLKKLLVGWDVSTRGREVLLENHIIICGYGRVGGWVGKALRGASVPFVVVDYNQKVVSSLRDSGENVIYGDPSEPEILETAGIKAAKAIVVAIPDRSAQEALVAHVQTVAPDVKIITRAHFDEDWEKLKALKVDKIVQPEFEAAIAITRSILTSMGRPSEEVSAQLTSLRHSHSART